MVIQMRYIQCRNVIDIICAIMSGRIKSAHPLHMRRCYLVCTARKMEDLMQAVFVFHTGFLCLDLRTHKLQVTLRPVQQTIISVTYLIQPIQLLCSKVDLPRLPLLGKLLSEAPEMRQSFLCPLFARNKSSGCSQICFFSSSLSSVLSHAWQLQSWNLATVVLHVSVLF